MSERLRRFGETARGLSGALLGIDVARQKMEMERRKNDALSNIFSSYTSEVDVADRPETIIGTARKYRGIAMASPLFSIPEKLQISNMLDEDMRQRASSRQRRIAQRDVLTGGMPTIVQSGGLSFQKLQDYDVDTGQIIPGAYSFRKVDDATYRPSSSELMLGFRMRQEDRKEAAEERKRREKAQIELQKIQDDYGKDNLLLTLLSSGEDVEVLKQKDPTLTGNSRQQIASELMSRQRTRETAANVWRVEGGLGEVQPGYYTANAAELEKRVSQMAKIGDLEAKRRAAKGKMDRMQLIIDQANATGEYGDAYKVAKANFDAALKDHDAAIAEMEKLKKAGSSGTTFITSSGKKVTIR